VTLTLEYGTQSLDASLVTYVPSGAGPTATYALLPGAQIPAGGVAIVFLDSVPGASLPPSNVACPGGVTAAMTTDSATHGTGIGSAFHIGASAPVVAYDSYPFAGAESNLTSATLLLPTSAWSVSYVAVDAFPADSTVMGLPFVQVVAEGDGTSVTINPVAAITGGPGVAAAASGSPQTYNLDKGQVLQLTQSAELGGSLVQSNLPIGVWGGSTLLEVTACCADSAHQQIPPLQALGSEYVAVRYRNRFAGTEESPPWRIVAVAGGTNLTYEPSAPAGAPVSLGQGQTALFNTNGPLVVRSQDGMHPFYMSAYMTGAQDPALPSATPTDGRGDAEFVNVVPPAQYLRSYAFFTDPSYPETDLVVVRTKGTTGFQDVTLDCAGVLTGWQPAGSSGDYEYTRVDLVTGNFVPQGSCNNGLHHMTSNNPFGVTVWGWGSAATLASADGGAGLNTQFVSYAYPAGAAAQPINGFVPSMAACAGKVCNGACVDTTSDHDNCSGCGVTCGPAEICSNSLCVCGGTMCSGVCLDTTSDNANCGGCGVPCAYQCQNSQCGPLRLASGTRGSLGIATDGTNVYWFDGSSGPLTLKKCPVAGCMNAPTIIASNVNPTTMAFFNPLNLLTIGGGRLYWPDSTNVMGALLASATPTPFFAGAATNAPVQVATDAARVYWADSTASVIDACPLGASCPTPTVLVNLAGTPDAGSVSPQGVAVDSSYVY
jgi:hypothetical protein